MEWKIPGTVLKCPREEAASLQARFEGMFLGGDIALSQVVAITGLEAHTIQNYFADEPYAIVEPYVEQSFPVSMPQALPRRNLLEGCRGRANFLCDPSTSDG